jgi:hypothetical protein
MCGLKNMSIILRNGTYYLRRIPLTFSRSIIVKKSVAVLEDRLEETARGKKRNSSGTHFAGVGSVRAF